MDSASRSGFVVRINTNDGNSHFCILWRPSHVGVGERASLRKALVAHQDDLDERLATLRLLLAGNWPERADRLLAAASQDVQVTELILQPQLDAERFETFCAERSSLRAAMTHEPDFVI